MGVKDNKNKGFSIFRHGIQELIAEGGAQQERLFLWLPVALGLGIAVYFGLPFEPPLWATGAGALILVVLFVQFFERRDESPRRFAACMGAGFGALVLLGLFAGGVNTFIRGTPILPPQKGPLEVTGTITQVENLEGKKGSRVLLEQVILEGIGLENTPRKVRLTFRKVEGLTPGARINTLAKLDPPSRAVFPDAYDFRRHLFFEGIGAVGFAFRPATLLETPERTDEALFFETLRQKIAREIAMRAGAVAGAVMTALITGERAAIPEEDNEAMRASGLYHLLSISGAHVGMVAGLLFFTLRLMMAAWPWLALRAPIKKIAAIIALSGAAFYVVLAGADIPALRALMMTGLVMVAIMLDRSPISLRLVAFAALVILTVAPHALIGVSFQMSFAAVAALVAFFEWTRPWWSGWQRQAGWVRRSVLYLAMVFLTSIIAGAMTGLYSLYHFQSFSVYGVFANMLAVPLTGIVIMPAAVTTLLLMPFGWEAPALAVMEWGTVWMLAIAHWVGGMEGATLRVPVWREAALFVISGGVILFLLWQGWRGKAGAALIVMIGVGLGVLTPRPDIMVSESGKLVAVRGDDDAYYLSTRRMEKFTAESWLRLMGQETEFSKSWDDEKARVMCDPYACRMERGGAHISVLKKEMAMHEECGWADLVIAPFPVKRCAAEVVDLYALRKSGASTLYLDTGRVKIDTVLKPGRYRPWS